MRVIKWTMFKFYDSLLLFEEGYYTKEVNMDFVNGRLYFIKDEFFDYIGEAYLKTNKEATQRPHYYAFKDNSTGLLWVIPCSTQIDKYKNIIKKKIENNKKHDHIKIIKVNGIEQAFLFQDMFPITEEYILNPYIKQDVFMEIKDLKKLAAIEKNANKIINLIRRGVKFTPTQPNIMRIEKILTEESGNQNKPDSNKDTN